MWSYDIVDHSTRSVLSPVQPASASWSRKLNVVSEGTFTFVVDSVLDWQYLTAPWSRIVVACWDGVPRYAGYISTRSYVQATRILTVNTSCIRAILAFRFPFAVVAGFTVPEYPDGTLTITGRSYSGAVRAALADQVIGGVPGRWDLPIVLPDDGAGSITQTFWNYEFWTIEAILAGFQNAENGPDIDFEPAWAADGTLEWVCRVGVPRLDSGTVDWVLGSTKGGITDLVAAENAQKYVDGVFTIGKGSEADMRWGADDGGVSLYTPVYRVAAHPYKELDDQALLTSQARADVAVYGKFTKQWSFSYEGTEAPGVAGVRLGTTTRLYSQGNPYLPDGWHDNYVIGFGGDATQKVTLEVQEIS